MLLLNLESQIAYFFSLRTFSTVRYYFISHNFMTVMMCSLNILSDPVSLSVWFLSGFLLYVVEGSFVLLFPAKLLCDNVYC